MKKRFMLAFLMLCASAFAVDNLTVESAGGQLSKIDWSWTSDGSGNASGVTTTAVPGALFAVSTVPDTTAVPTDNYDVILQNQVTGFDGSAVVITTDRASSLLLNRDSVNTEMVEFWTNTSGYYTVQGKLKLSVSNAGASRSGRIVVTVHRSLSVIGFQGSVTSPIGSTLGTFLQWASPGVSKWVAASGDATLADGGAFTVVNDSHTHGVGTLTATGTPGATTYLRGDGAWAVPAGSGDVVGPGVATNNGIVLFDTTTGKLIKDSTYTFPIADAQGSDTWTASIVKGSGTTTDAVDLATAEVAGTLPDANVADTLTIGSGSTMSSPPAIGGVAPAAGTFTTVTSTGNFNSTQTAQTFIYHTPASGAASIRINPLPAAVTDAASVDFFRSTNSTDASEQNIYVYKGNNSTTLAHQFRAGTGPLQLWFDTNGVERMRVTNGTGAIEWEGATDDAFETTITPADVTADVDVAGFNVSGTAKARTPIWLSAAAGQPTTANPATAPSTDASDNWYMDFDTTADAAFWQIPIPADFDGSIDAATVYWYQIGSTAAITWTLDAIAFADGDAITGAYGADFATAADTPGAISQVQIVQVTTPSALLGTSANAGKVAKVRVVATGTYTTNHPYLLGVKLEY